MVIGNLPSVFVQVLLMAGLTYLVAGPACAGLAKLALIFLATGALEQ